MSLLSVAARTVTDWVKLGFPEEVAKRIVSGELPMDKASRMKRAEEQGYDVSRQWYHGTNDDFKEFDPERVGSAYGVDDQGFYFTSSENEAMKWAENAPKADSPRVMESLLAMKNPWLIDAPNGRSPVEYFESGEGVFNRGQNAAVDYGIESGYDGMVVRGGEEDMAVAFDPSRIRSREAAFDPQYKGANILGNADPRLLAGIAAGGGGVSAATALSNKLAAAQAVKERGNIRAPNSGMLHSITMGARDLERRLEGHPAALLFPEGVVKYLEQLNREERPNRETVLWALLDMI